MPRANPAIAATPQARGTVTGQLEDLQPGFMLCEDMRPQRQSYRSRFVVRPWSALHSLLLGKGIRVITTGDPGPSLNPAPLLRKAAGETDDAERKALYLAEAEKCELNGIAAEAARKQKPLTPEEKLQQTQLATAKAVADGVAQGIAPAMQALADAQKADKKG